MKEPAVVTLEGKEFKVQQLTLGQIEDLSIAVVLADSPDDQESVKRTFRRTLETLAAALSADYPEMTVDKLRQMRISRDELRAANRTVLEFAGLVPSGEAPAGAA